MKKGVSGGVEPRVRQRGGSSDGTISTTAWQQRAHQHGSITAVAAAQNQPAVRAPVGEELKGSSATTSTMGSGTKTKQQAKS